MEERRRVERAVGRRGKRRRRCGVVEESGRKRSMKTRAQRAAMYGGEGMRREKKVGTEAGSEGRRRRTGDRMRGRLRGRGGRTNRRREEGQEGSGGRGKTEKGEETEAGKRAEDMEEEEVEKKRRKRRLVRGKARGRDEG